MPEDASGVDSGPMPEGEPMLGRESGVGSGEVGPALSSGLHSRISTEEYLKGACKYRH